MKSIFFFLAIYILHPPMISGQSFIGNINYNYSYTSKLPNITDDQFNQYMGTEQAYSINEDMYMSQMNGMSMEFQVYDAQNNRLLNKFQDNDTIYTIDASTVSDEISEFDIADTDVIVLGYKCKVLKLTTKSGTSEYYFSPAIKVDPNHFKKHNYGNWAFIVSQTQSIPIKTHIENEQFIMESVATEIKEENVTIDIDKILKDRSVKKMQF
jgi:hypothetical protein